jgi:CDP-diacylglycerol---serine O-phosphatidyltransferase
MLKNSDDTFKLQKKVSKLRKQLVHERLKGSRFLLPNLVTVAHMFCGFLAVVYSASNRYEKAIIAIALATLLDGLDGRVARKFNATSHFGLEFDSLSDLISFGVAPAILVYNWCFKELADEFGVAVCFFYVVAIATRLARFNVSAANLKSFMGLPSPAAAGMVIAVVNAFVDLPFTSIKIGLISLLMIVVSLLTVSRFSFFSVKLIKLSHLSSGVPLIAAPLIVILWYNNKLGILTLVTAYIVSGPIGWVYGFLKKKDPVKTE